MSNSQEKCMPSDILCCVSVTSVSEVEKKERERERSTEEEEKRELFEG